MENLENWVFIYNVHMKHWMGTTKEHEKDLRNNYNSKWILKCELMPDMIEIICNKLEGDIDKLRIFTLTAESF